LLMPWIGPIHWHFYVWIPVVLSYMQW
jgi:hypothetical protein